jgi:hypothetical protein
MIAVGGIIGDQDITVVAFLGFVNGGSRRKYRGMTKNEINECRRNHNRFGYP